MTKKKPHKDYDFAEKDKVFIEDYNALQNIVSIKYFMLCYEQEVAAWMLIPYTDKHFSTPKQNSEGKVVAEFLFEYGYDVLEKVEDYDLDELE